MPLEYIPYVRKPFTVTACEVTKDNIEQLNKDFKIGTIDTKPDGTPFIIVTNTHKIPNVSRIFPGYFMTKMGKNMRCFSRKIFFQQFETKTPWWDEFFAGEESPEK